MENVPSNELMPRRARRTAARQRSTAAATRRIAIHVQPRGRAGGGCDPRNVVGDRVGGNAGGPLPASSLAAQLTLDCKRHVSVWVGGATPKHAAIGRSHVALRTTQS